MSTQEAAPFIAILMAGGFAVITAVFSIPLYALWSYHKRKLEEIRSKRDVHIAEETRRAIADLREEMKQLRDSTSAYDVSLDNALERLESRIETVEQRNRYGESIGTTESLKAGRQ